MYRFTKKYLCCPGQNASYDSKTQPQQTKKSSPLFSCLIVLVKRICAMPRIVGVSSLVDMLTQWFEFLFSRGVIS